MVFIVNPKQALRINITAPEYDNVIVSGYQTAGSVGCVDAGSIAMIVSLPEFALSRGATLHMEGAAPLPLISGTTQPPTLAQIATPVSSLFQARSGRAEKRSARWMGEAPHRLHGDRKKRHVVTCHA